MTRSIAPAGRRLAAALGAALALLSLARCASPGIPPGGPPDVAPPHLVRVSPDTGATNVRARDVEMLFDEVVSEVPSSGGGGGGGFAGSSGGSFGGGAGAGGPSLASIVLVSPRSGALSVDWHRERITIHPRRAFRANTTYTITVLPGLGDLRGNVRDTAIVTTFSTGPTLDRGRLGGIVFDWVTGKPAARAVVEGIAPDSTTWVAITDSVGRFVLRNLPAVPLVVRGVLDANGNREFDVREAFDTVRAPLTLLARGDSANIEILAFVHDTIGARISTITVRDSMTLRLTFDRPLDPLQPITADRFRLAARDSSVVPIAMSYVGAMYDSLLAQRQRASADSAARAAAAKDTTPRRTPPVDTAAARRDSAARRDTTRGGRRPPAPPPVASRASPPTEVVLVLAQPLRPNTFYRVSVRGQRSVSGTTVALSERTFSTPKPEPPKPPADSTRRAPGDTAARRPPAGAPAATPGATPATPATPAAPAAPAAPATPTPRVPNAPAVPPADTARKRPTR